MLALPDLLDCGDVVVLSGAGISTDSGIPDYRGPSGTLRRHAPMTYQEFTGSAAARQRYWARSHVGWRRIAQARPNDCHRAVAALERRGAVTATITQNVDGLHQAGGAERVTELHGALARTRCLACGDVRSRRELQQRLADANPGFDAEVDVRPDGDADVAAEAIARFVTVGCRACGADALKPDVVFFGETVPRERVDHCYGLVHNAKSLLVLGSSLQVQSGFRFVRRAHERGIPIAIINQGPTRGDHLATVRLDARLSEVLPAYA